MIREVGSLCLASGASAGVAMGKKASRRGLPEAGTTVDRCQWGPNLSIIRRFHSMSQHKMRQAISVVGFALTGILLCTSLAWAAKDARPFWTEKSSFIEGEELFVVGVASKARTVEEGRRQAFEQGKVELMNFAQITSLEAQGLVIETQMTFEEPNADGTVTVYRLLRVPASKLVGIQGRLKEQSHAQEQAIEQSRKELAVIQQTLGEKATKLDQQQRQVEQMLQQINAKLQASSTPTNRSERGGSLVDRLKDTDAKLDASDANLPGHSLIDIARGHVPKRTILSEYHAAGAITGTSMIRHGKYKYIYYLSINIQHSFVNWSHS